MGLDTQGDGGADDGAHLEDGPEEGEGAALVLLLRVGHHDGPLGRPQERGGGAEDGAREDEEPAGAVGLVGPEAADVDGVTGGADGQGQFRAKHVLGDGIRRVSVCRLSRSKGTENSR